VLFAGVGAVLTWLLVCRLYPGKTAMLPSPRVTDDHFVLEMQAPGAQADRDSMRRLFLDCHASAVEESEHS
jgi:hypothetical protein